MSRDLGSDGSHTLSVSVSVSVCLSISLSLHLYPFPSSLSLSHEGWSDPLRPPRSAPSPQAQPSARRAAPAHSPPPQVRT